MSEPMTEERLVEIEARAAAAEGGPWFVTGMDTIKDDGKQTPDTFVISYDDVWLAEMIQSECMGDAEFIAAARSDVPDLCAEIRRLRSLLAGLAYDDGDLKATGEWVARRFQEFRAERDRLRAALGQLQGHLHPNDGGRPRDLAWMRQVIGAAVGDFAYCGSDGPVVLTRQDFNALCDARAERDALRTELAALRIPAVSAPPSIEPFRQFLDDDARKDLTALQAAVQRHDVEHHYRRVSGWVEHGRITEPLRAEMAAVLREKVKVLT